MTLPGRLSFIESKISVRVSTNVGDDVIIADDVCTVVEGVVDSHTDVFDTDDNIDFHGCVDDANGTDDNVDTDDVV